MSYLIRSTGALAVLWLVALAATPAFGQNNALPDSTNPNSPVPPTRYVPMPVAGAAAAATSPAENWKAANQTVAAYDSMSLTMEMAAPENAGAMAPRPPSAQPTVPPAPDGHSHHMNKAVK